MTYTSLNADRAYSLREEFAKLQALQPGQMVLIEAPSPEALARTRLDIYTWLALKALKPHFKVRRLSPTSLIVNRLDTRPPISRVVERASFEKIRDFVLENMLDCTEPQMAHTIVEHSRLSPEERLEAFAEWQRVCGPPSEAS